MKRVAGWEHRLREYLAERRAMPFTWGTHDCCTFACGGLAVQGLPNPMADVPPYDSIASAVDRLVSLGGDLPEVAPRLAQSAGLDPVPVAYAGRGSVVLAQVGLFVGMKMALGLVSLNGRHSYFPGEQGLVMVPTLRCLQAWSCN